MPRITAHLHSTPNGLTTNLISAGGKFQGDHYHETPLGSTGYVDHVGEYGEHYHMLPLGYVAKYKRKMSGADCGLDGRQLVQNEG